MTTGSPEDEIVCPLCGRALSDEPCNDDHVFGQAFGGRATVRAHRACNNTLGHKQEGQLHRRNTLMSVVRAARGLPAPELRGTTAEGTKVDIDMASGRSHQARPTVAATHSTDGVELSASGAEEHLRGVLKDWRRKYGDVVPAFDELPPEARQELISDPTEVNVAITHDLNAAKGFAVKAAIGAGVLAYGDSFASSHVARALREYRDTDSDASPVEGLEMSVNAMPALDQAMTQQADQYEAGGLARPDLPGLADSGGANDVIFVPVGKNTAVFVRVLGVPLTNGIIVDAELPSGELGRPAAPVLVRESGDGLLIVDFTERLLAPVAALAEAEAQTLSEEE